jgi:hypothetical protein
VIYSAILTYGTAGTCSEVLDVVIKNLSTTFYSNKYSFPQLQLLAIAFTLSALMNQPFVL